MNLKKLEFIKLDPAGNSTLLYDIKNLKKEEIIKISESLKKKEYLDAEQIGFIDENHIQMLGGEFCGNASRSFGVYLAKNDKEFQKRKSYTITCSGEKTPIELEIIGSTAENRFFSKIKMPRYISMQDIDLNRKKICKVEFSGITHFIIESKGISSSVVELIKSYCKKYKIKNFGIMFFDKEDYFMVPYVNIKSIGGCWENSCASGTAALGFYLGKDNNFDSININQPGGLLVLSIENDELYINGPINILAEGISYIDY